MEEQWKPVVGFEGLYEVSNLGRVKSLHYDKERIIKLTIKRKYVIVVLVKNGKQKNLQVHRLVLIAFIGEPKVGQECDHIDRNSINNRLDNLRWATRAENCSNRNGYGKCKLKGVSIYDKYQKRKNGTFSKSECIISQIYIKKERFHLGYYKTEEEAHEAYKQAFKKHYGYEWMG